MLQERGLFSQGILLELQHGSQDIRKQSVFDAPISTGRWGAIALNISASVNRPGKYLGTIKPKTQNAVVPALRAPQHFGF